MSINHRSAAMNQATVPRVARPAPTGKIPGLRVILCVVLAAGFVGLNFGDAAAQSSLRVVGVVNGVPNPLQQDSLREQFSSATSIVNASPSPTSNSATDWTPSSRPSDLPAQNPA